LNKIGEKPIYGRCLQDSDSLGRAQFCGPRVLEKKKWNPRWKNPESRLNAHIEAEKRIWRTLIEQEAWWGAVEKNGTGQGHVGVHQDSWTTSLAKIARARGIRPI